MYKFRTNDFPDYKELNLKDNKQCLKFNWKQSVEYYTLIINTGQKEIKLMDVVVFGSTCSHNNLAYNREC